MTYRTIMIFPDLTQAPWIQAIREQYDPLAQLVAPHVTLVFPFEDETISLEQIKASLARVTETVSPFKLSLKGIVRREEYLFLEVKEGADVVTTLHDTLYQQDIFQAHLHPSIPYQPHLTVGRLATEKEAETVLQTLCNVSETFETLVTKIAVEEIGPNDESVIIWEHVLSQ